MNTYLLCSVVFLFCSVMNLFNAWRSGNGIGYLFGFVWLMASVLLFFVYRKSTKMKNEKTEGEEKA